MDTKDKIVFGSDQLLNETPAPVKLVYQVFMFVSGFWAMCIEPRFPQIPDHIIAEVNTWLLFCNSALYFVSKFFGWQKLQ